MIEKGAPGGSNWLKELKKQADGALERVKTREFTEEERRTAEEIIEASLDDELAEKVFRLNNRNGNNSLRLRLAGGETEREVLEELYWCIDFSNNRYCAWLGGVMHMQVDTEVDLGLWGAVATTNMVAGEVPRRYEGKIEKESIQILGTRAVFIMTRSLTIETLLKGHADRLEEIKMSMASYAKKDTTTLKSEVEGE